MKRKTQSTQIGIRVKNIDSKRTQQPLQYYQQSTILSQPFSLTLSNNDIINSESRKMISQSLSIDLISQIEKLNSQMTIIAQTIKQKDIRIQQLENKCKTLQSQNKKVYKELKQTIEDQNNQIKRKNQQIEWKNQQIQRYRGELNLHIDDIRAQNKQMITQLINQLRVHRQKESKQTTQILMDHERTLKSIQQNSIIQRQIQQNSILQKQVQQISARDKQPSVCTSPQGMSNRSPSIKRIKIQRPKISAQNFKPLKQIIRINTINDLHQSLRMLSPLALNIQQLDSKQQPKARAKFLRKQQLQNLQLYGS